MRRGPRYNGRLTVGDWNETSETEGEMKVRIETEEWYPVFSVREDDGFGAECDVTEERLAYWKRVFVEFDAVQAEMRKLSGRK